MRILNVAEKPSMAREIVYELTGRRGPGNIQPTANRFIKNLYFEVSLPNMQSCEMIMTSVAGHLHTVDFPSHLNNWQNVDPVSLFDAPLETKVSGDMRAVGDNLRQLASRCDRLVIWTDCDREGEYIGWEIEQECRKSNPRIDVYRARYSVVRQRELMGALQQGGRLDLRQVEAVQVRIELDLRTGASLTRLQSIRIKPEVFSRDGSTTTRKDSPLSYGSCQFPTLGFVVEQYLRCMAFRSQPFWYLHLEADGISMQWSRGRLFDRLACLCCYALTWDSQGILLTKLDTKPAQRRKPLPLRTVEFQKHASRLLHLSPKALMDSAEKLYRAGFISYPRTETDQFDSKFDFRSLIERQRSDRRWGEYAGALLDRNGFRVPRQGSHNDNAHPPIHPTKAMDASAANDFSEADCRVYEYVVRRYLASCSEDAKGEETMVEGRTVKALKGDHRGNLHATNPFECFRVKGVRVIERNYLEVYSYDKWTGIIFPAEWTVGRVIPLRVK